MIKIIFFVLLLVVILAPILIRFAKRVIWRQVILVWWSEVLKALSE